MIDESTPFKEVVELFGRDRFATERAGCRVLEAEKGHSVVAFDITDEHRNAQGQVMGGAIYTLADFATAVAGNIGQDPSVTASAEIRYLNTAKGTKLIATCDADKAGRSLGFFRVEITDDLGTQVALMTSTLYRIPQK